MICHRTGIIFIHQRKCAGTSVIHSFGISPSQPEWHLYNDGVLSPEFDQRPRDYSVVAVVRNPWARFVSGWKYCKSTQARPIADVLRDLPREGHDYRHLTRPQQATLFHPDGTPVFDELLRFERLAEDFRDFQQRHRMVPVPLPLLNSGRRGDYRSYFDPETQRMFYTHFQKDIQWLGYSF
jgi:hypothetical protein